MSQKRLPDEVTILDFLPLSCNQWISLTLPLMLFSVNFCFLCWWSLIYKSRFSRVPRVIYKSKARLLSLDLQGQNKAVIFQATVSTQSCYLSSYALALHYNLTLTLWCWQVYFIKRHSGPRAEKNQQSSRQFVTPFSLGYRCNSADMLPASSHPVFAVMMTLPSHRATH